MLAPVAFGVWQLALSLSRGRGFSFLYKIYYTYTKTNTYTDYTTSIVYKLCLTFTTLALKRSPRTARAEDRKWGRGKTGKWWGPGDCDSL